MRLIKEHWPIILIIIFYLSFQIPLLISLKQIPSPLYGGDYWYSHGAVQHFISGGNVLKGSNILESEPGYLPVYTVIAGIPGLMGLSAFDSMKIMSLIIMTAAIIIFYSLIKRLFGNNLLSITSTIIYLSMISFPIWKYRQFTNILILPLFLLTAINFYKKPDIKKSIILGITAGIFCLSHATGIIITAVFLSLLSLLMIIDDKTEMKKTIIKMLLIALITLSIAMIYWGGPIIKGLEMPESSLYEIKFDNFLDHINYSKYIFEDYIINFQNPLLIIRSLLFITGIIILLLLKKHFPEDKFVIIIFLTAIIGTFHQIITLPLLGTSFSPLIIGTIIFPLTTVMVGTITINLLISVIPGKIMKPTITIIIIILLAINVQIFINNNDRFLENAKEPQEKELTTLTDWVLKNTDVNDVFISSNELSFSINALTGRKVLNTRRAQNSPFINMDERQLSAAIILYGNNTESRKELIKKYEIKYLYWNPYWLLSDFRFDEQGQLIGRYDPLIVRDNQYNEEKLKEHGIRYYKEYEWIDPAVHEPLRKENLIIILPSQININQPWNEEIELKQLFETNNNIIYEVKI